MEYISGSQSCPAPTQSGDFDVEILLSGSQSCPAPTQSGIALIGFPPVPSVINGLAYVGLDGVVNSFSPGVSVIKSVLKGYTEGSVSIDAVIFSSETWTDLSGVIKSVSSKDLFGVIKADGDIKPLIEQDYVFLRTTGVYESPRDINTPLNVVYGSWLGSSDYVPLTLINVNKFIYHISDIPVLSVDSVYKKSGSSYVRLTTGYSVFTNYRDETARLISVVKFNTYQSDELFVRCQGRHSNGYLYDNPADVVLDILQVIQGYSDEFIDFSSIRRFRAQCKSAGIKIKLLLDTNNMTVKTIMAVVARSCNAVHTVNQGAHGLVRRGGIL